MSGDANTVPVTNGGWFYGYDMTLGPVVVLLVGVTCVCVDKSFSSGAMGVVMSYWWFGRMVVEGCSRCC